MKKPALAIALTLAAVASASPAFGMEFCKNADSKLYVFLGELGNAIQKGHAPAGHGVAHFIEAAIAENIIKAAARDHFHIPACPVIAGPVFKFTPEALEAFKRSFNPAALDEFKRTSNSAGQEWKMSPETVERLKHLELPE